MPRAALYICAKVPPANASGVLKLGKPFPVQLKPNIRAWAISYGWTEEQALRTSVDQLPWVKREMVTEEEYEQRMGGV